uniref:SCP domain-containing protein n=1 Tax=Nymphaea colorata TaxID=210225 RepID=A0A5K1GMG4_9MAGN
MELKHKSSLAMANVLALNLAAGLKGGCHSQNSPQDFVAAHNEAQVAMGLPPLSGNSPVAAYA